MPIEAIEHGQSRSIRRYQDVGGQRHSDIIKMAPITQACERRARNHVGDCPMSTPDGKQIEAISRGLIPNDGER
jgi:hypothetical protein